MNYQALAVVIGPVIVTAILGPTLLFLMSKARFRAETENVEVQSDMHRFEAMDLLVTHLRKEVDRLIADTQTERHTASELRQQVVMLRAVALQNERIAVDLTLWTLSVLDAVEAGRPIPARPAKINEFLQRWGGR